MMTNRLMFILVISVMMLNPVVALPVNSTGGVTAYCQNTTTYVVDPFSGECKTYNDTCVPAHSIKVGTCPPPQIVEKIVEKQVEVEKPCPVTAAPPPQIIQNNTIIIERQSAWPNMSISFSKFKEFKNPDVRFWWFGIVVLAFAIAALYYWWKDIRKLNDDEDFLFKKVYQLMYDRSQKREKIFTKEQLMESLKNRGHTDRGNHYAYTPRRIKYIYDRAVRARIKADPETRRLFGW